MEKDLLDISREDEDSWLLKNTPKKGVTSFSGSKSGRNRSYFDCSPPQIPTSNRITPTRPPFSPIRGLKGKQPSPSIDTDSVGKENSSGNKVELPKLSVERQQMKKKKKQAGFNLRKSLAWDRAFSTEEGVLDSLELSIVTGSDCQTAGGLLPTIQEEFRESLSASKCTTGSPGLQALEENLFKDLPVNSKYRVKKTLSGVLSKYASPSIVHSSLAQRKVLPATDLRSGSKRSGCPRPPPSSSLKRPANVHTTTPHNRELSVSKVSTTRSNPLTVANNMKRITQSPSRAKPIEPTQSKNSQRNLGSVNSSKKNSSTKSKTQSSLASKSSIPKPSYKQARRNVISKPSEIPSASNANHSVSGKLNVGPMTRSDAAVLGNASSYHDSNVITMTTQRSCSSFGNNQAAISQVAKPSGLRAPSPSIGYFNQSNFQLPHSVGDKHSQIPRSDVSSSSHFSSIPTFKKSQVAEKVQSVHTEAITGNMSRLGSAAGFSSQSSFLKASQEKVQVDSKRALEVEPKVLCCSLSSPQNQCIIQGDADRIHLDDVSIYTPEKIPTAEYEEFQNNGEVSPSDCKNNVQEATTSDGKRNDKRKSFCSVEVHCALPLKHGPHFSDSMANSEVRDMDLVTESDCSDEDPEDNLELKKVDQATELEHTNDIDEFFVKGTLDQGYPDLEALHTALDLCEKTKTLVSESFSSSPSIFGGAVSLNEDSDFSRISECMSKEDSECGCLKLNNNVGKAESQVNTEKELSDQAADQETGSHEEEEVQVLRISADHVAFATREGESGIPTPMNKAFSVGDGLIKKPVTDQEIGTEEDEVQVINKSSDSVTFATRVEESGTPTTMNEAFAVGNAMIITDQETDTQEEEDVQILRISANPVAFATREEESETAAPVKEAFSVGDVVIKKPITDQELGSHDEEEVQVIRISADSVVFATREEESETPTPMDETFSVGDVMIKKPVTDKKTGSEDEEKEVKVVRISANHVGSATREIESGTPTPMDESFSEGDVVIKKPITDQEIGSHEEGEVQVIGMAAGPVAFATKEEESGTPTPMDEVFLVQDILVEKLVTNQETSSHEEEEVQVVRSPANAMAFATREEESRTSTPMNEVLLVQDILVEKLVTNQETDSHEEGEVQVIKSPSNAVAFATREEESGTSTSMNVAFSDEDVMSKKLVSDQKTGSQEEEEVQVLRISADPVGFANRDEESGTLTSMNDDFSVRDVMQPKESSVLRDNTCIYESHASGSSSSLLNESQSSTSALEGKDETIQLNDQVEKRPDPLIVKPPPNAVPFSDEWLAAIEAVGEEILTLKSGRVQHSPPEKSAPEPSPWSPVKRKNNQEVGPFDCTKYTNRGLPPTSD